MSGTWLFLSVGLAFFNLGLAVGASVERWKRKRLQDTPKEPSLLWIWIPLPLMLFGTVEMAARAGWLPVTAALYKFLWFGRVGTASYIGLLFISILAFAVVDLRREMRSR